MRSENALADYRRNGHCWWLGTAVIVQFMLSSVPGLQAGDGSLRQVISLNGAWSFHRDGAEPDDRKQVKVPSTFQDTEGSEFHGVGWYKRSVPTMKLSPGQRVVLHFDAVATEAQVWWDGHSLGSHLGGWTPFRFDVTDLVRTSPPGAGHEIKVRVDEKVGHNTQGFLPTIQPHFGGIWQDVKLLIVSERYIDDLNIQTWGDTESGAFQVSFSLAGSSIVGKPDADRPAQPAPGSPSELLACVRVRKLGTKAWSPIVAKTSGPASNRIALSVPVPDYQLWSPESPALYELEIDLTAPTEIEEQAIDRVNCRAAFRNFQTHSHQFLLNGRAVALRGVLNWGYYPPGYAPFADERRWREDIRFAQRSGFNLMKFCLWVPPKRFLELADEMGCLVWMEYPTWHPTLTQKHLPDLQREFAEFFHYDRNHPSVVLRSLTCETGPGAELPVIQALYDQAHREIPGAVVEDDSSWIGWNRVHDFYDDHPYGNNHTWVQTLTGFKKHIQDRGVKPMALGEAIAADTWFDPAALLKKTGPPRPFWLPGFLEAMDPWRQRLEKLAGPLPHRIQQADSSRYAMLMRKFQVEALRREMPAAGYVISVMRDFSLASMGLLDYQDQPKWPASDWSWQGETVCLLKTEEDRRCFTGGDLLHAELWISHFGARQIDGLQIACTIEDDRGRNLFQIRTNLAVSPPNGSLLSAFELSASLPEYPVPERLGISAEAKWDGGRARNQWPVWIVPKATDPSPTDLQHKPDRPEVVLHRSISDERAAELLPAASKPRQLATNSIVVAAHFDDDLVNFLEQGGRVLMLPDGQKGSFPLANHWFLRGAPVVASHAIIQKAPRDFWIDLQHFDLAGPVMPDLKYLEMTRPILLLWDTHDLKTVKTHGLVFECRASRGHLLVSALKHHPQTNAAGQWVLRTLLDYLATAPTPEAALSPAAWQHLKDKLHEEKIDLVKVPWQFKPDPTNIGRKEDWASPELHLDETWKEIKIGVAWEGQGYPRLDGWACYRLTQTIPAAWTGREVYLTFEGVDDSYELFVNGHLVATEGDQATRQDTFNQRKSHRISPWVKPGADSVIVVHVNDWQGAGGIFRPVTLGTAGLASDGELIK